MNKRKSLRDVVFVVLILILVLVIILSGLRVLESTSLIDKHVSQSEVSSKTYIKNGVEYFPRQDITVVMLVGIDQEGEAKPSASYNNSGAADMVALIIFDETNKLCNVICLNRDTMLTIPVLGIGGKEAGTTFGQLALSHTYGSGMKDSCENVKKTVSNFLLGININYYISMRMDAIGILNDSVGGVTVEVKDDFSAVDSSITVGQYTLKGEQAMTFVRSRGGIGSQLNVSRMERQKEYIENFMNAFNAKSYADETFVLSAYDAVDEYIVTDCSTKTLTSLADKFYDYKLNEIVSPEGKNTIGEEYYEFYVNEDALEELVLRLLYAPK